MKTCFRSVFYRPVSLLLVVAAVINSSLSWSAEHLSRSRAASSWIRRRMRRVPLTSVTRLHHGNTIWAYAHYYDKIANQTHPLAKCTVHTHNYIHVNHCSDNTKQACHRCARSKMEWIYTRIKVSGHGSLELAQENRKKERFFEHLVLAYIIELMNDLGPIR